jgi:dTMP kinase
MQRKRRGAFIVLEGTDGSGKTTQFKRLVSRLKRAGYKVATFDFPQYAKPSSYFVKEYLNGRYGGWREVGPYQASIFYALDRFDVGQKIRKQLREGKIIVSNRYVASNMGHQGAKIGNPRERKKFFRWLYKFEYELLGIPRPEVTIVFHVPAAIAQRLVDKKGAREYIGGVKRDVHEADIKHLRRAEATYLDIVRTFPRDFKLVECVARGRLLSPEAIGEKVWQILKQRLKIK